MTVKKPTVILFGGFAQHGKDSSCNMLSGLLESYNKKVFVIRYGDYLKYVCASRFNWNGEKDKKGRTILQQVGTEEARASNPNVWVNVVIETAKAFASNVDYIMIPDFRYPNEYSRWKEEHYKVITVWVHRKNFDNGLTEEQKAHMSETSLLDFPFNYIINVDEGLENLSNAVMKMKDRYNL